MLRLLARAKINWTLDILGRREDGYHWMDMLMESVDLGDELCLIPAQQELQLTVTGAEGLAMPDNLVLKAARALQAETGCRSGATFLLTKRAPVGAGMGGGSADAAAALVGLNRLWETNLSPKRLAELGLSVGADVPFLLLGGLARVGGIGETLQPLTAARPVPLVAVQPCQALSTREVFTAFDALPRVNHPQTDTAQAALIRRDFAALSGLAGNVLAQASEAKRPQIAEAIAALEAFGAAFATMTGSGSAVFGAFETEREASLAYLALRKRWRRCWLTRTSPEGIAFLPETENAP